MDGRHFVFFSVCDTKGRTTEVLYNKDKGFWNCACKGWIYAGWCGHVDECKEYAKTRRDLDVVTNG